MNTIRTIPLVLLIAAAGLYVFVRETVLGRPARWKLPLPRNR